MGAFSHGLLADQSLQESMRPRFSPFNWLILCLVLGVQLHASATVAFDPFSGNGQIGRHDVLTFVSKTEVPVHPVVTHVQRFTLTQACTKMVAGLPRQTAAIEHLERQRLIAIETQTNPATREITGYLLRGYLQDIRPLPVDLCSRAFIQGEPGWLPLGGVNAVPVGQGTLLFNGKVMPF